MEVIRNIYDLIPRIEGPEIWPPWLEEELLDGSLEDDPEITIFYQTCDFCPVVGHNSTMTTVLVDDEGGVLAMCYGCLERLNASLVDHQIHAQCPG